MGELLFAPTLFYGGKSTALLINRVIQIQEICIQIQEMNKKTSY